jgi:hypothetical protein
MAIKVIPATAIALTVSFVEPGFSVWADYKVEVEYVDASYVAEWREIKVEAAVSRPDVLAVDVINPIDETVLDFTKSLKDAPVVQEALAKDFSKPAQDSYGLFDAPAKALSKFLASSSAGFLDEIQIIQLKTLADSLVPGDAQAKAFTKALQDFQSFTDAVALATDKSLDSEVITLSDATNLTYIIGKQLEDLQTVVESLAYALEKAPFLEDLHMIDNMDGDIEFGIVKAIGELQLLAEQIQSIDTIKALADTPIVDENLAKSIVKAPFVDSVTPNDTTAVDSSKALTDGVIAAQTQIVKDVSKALADIYTGFVDTIAYQFSKSLADIQNLEEVLAKDFDKSLTDVYTGFVDTTALDFDKSLADIYTGFVDTTALGFGKALSDTQSIEESLVKDFSKSLVDIQNIVEALAKNTDKSLADNAAAQDVYASTLDKLLQDTTTPLSQTSLSINKVFSDTIEFADEIAVIKFIVRDFTDTLDALDQYVVDIQPSKQDTAGVIDEESLAFAAAKADMLIMLDNMDGDLTYAIVKSLTTEILAVSEKTVIASALQKADNAVLGSAGSLLSQDYVEPGYFAEDYVGTSRTFS